LNAAIQVSLKFDSARYNLHEHEFVSSCKAFYDIVHVYWISTEFKSFQSNGTIRNTMRKRDVDYDKKKKTKAQKAQEMSYIT
jgi:hypothetical protein